MSPRYSEILSDRTKLSDVLSTSSIHVTPESDNLTEKRDTFHKDVEIFSKQSDWS